MKHLLAIDWGTSSLRGALLGADGRVLGERSVARGILGVAPGDFGSVLTNHFGDWLSRLGTLCLIAGMAGSRQGWVEAPYCACPAGFDDVAGRLCWVEPGRIAIVPGLSCVGDGDGGDGDGHGDGGVPDVMRGEETQIFGALALLGIDAGLLVLPGTHSKWATVEAGRIARFSTSMTGEFYALLRRHSILARTMAPNDGALDAAAFDAGVAHALRSAGLLRSAFGARTLALFGRLSANEAPSYLSGLVIGEELRSQTLGGVRSVVVIGAAALTDRYRRALGQLDIDVLTLGSDATWRGLHAIATSWGRAGPAAAAAAALAPSS